MAIAHVPHFGSAAYVEYYTAAIVIKVLSNVNLFLFCV